MSEKIKFNWIWVGFDVAEVVHENLKEGQEVEINGVKCRIGDYLVRFEQDKENKIVAISKEDMNKFKWLSTLLKDEDVMNFDVIKEMKGKK